ncbi:DUF2793 domain-containing protein [Loktanella sp. IMCC34160]|uniref:DUF2793 domain-containing protein n=1 Tax=Loktanella sp. IMCC34160 TaxID=2510646 RepID=UPI00101DFC7E|nr:DUF2793 domain-containing protein [Loktanella sp. IMCC34160]RYG89513.1 DUF2793 domain-containing protein [Loktanella sp. IMCC34160]
MKGRRMWSDKTPSLELPLILPSQAQKHVTHNEALRILDVASQLAVRDGPTPTPPVGPTTGDCYLVGTGATGDWAGQDQSIAQWTGTYWDFIPPKAGWRADVAPTGATWRFDGTQWEPAGTYVDQLGVSTTADATNRLAVLSEASLFTHDGAGHQMKINKATAPDTASFLYQTNWSGRAELGTIGSDDFSVKVSPDGTSWITALSFDATDATVSGQSVQQSPTDTTPGRLMRADFGYGPGNLVGIVSETAGAPTGAVLEYGQNANGRYVRFADGTQMCWHREAAVSPGWATWAFPAMFVDNNYAQTIMPNPGLSPRCCVTGSKGVASVDFAVFIPTNGNQSAATCDMSVIGRWF